RSVRARAAVCAARSVPAAPVAVGDAAVLARAPRGADAARSIAARSRFGGCGEVGARAVRLGQAAVAAVDSAESTRVRHLVVGARAVVGPGAVAPVVAIACGIERRIPART